MPNFLDDRAISDPTIKEEVRVTLRKSFLDMEQKRKEYQKENPIRIREYTPHPTTVRQCEKCFKLFDKKILVCPDWHVGKTKMLYCPECMKIKIEKRNRLLNKVK